MLDILMDAGLDSVKMLPFLYLAYLLIEWIERTRGSRIEALLAEGSRWGAAVGALLGTIPQCGFSAMAASLYGSGVITLGTLMAVFIATSDEAIPMLLAVPERWPELAMLILIKLCIALAVGLLLDLVVTRLLPAPLRGGFTGKAAAVDCHEEHEEEQGIWMQPSPIHCRSSSISSCSVPASESLSPWWEKNSLPASCSRPAPSSQ